MPFRPCCSRVGPLPDPNLCCSCVGRSSPASRRACTPDPAPAHRHARPPATRRPAAAGYPLAHRPSRYPRGQTGMTHRNGQSMRRQTKSTHIEYLQRSALGRRFDIKHRSSCSGYHQQAVPAWRMWPQGAQQAGRRNRSVAGETCLAPFSEAAQPFSGVLAAHNARKQRCDTVARRDRVRRALARGACTPSGACWAIRCARSAARWTCVPAGTTSCTSPIRNASAAPDSSAVSRKRIALPEPSCAGTRKVAPPNGMMPRPISSWRNRTSSAAITMPAAAPARSAR
jgi:hypothetical protein